MQRYAIAGHSIQISGEGLDSPPRFGLFLSKNVYDLPLLVICVEEEVMQDEGISFFALEDKGANYNFFYKNDVWFSKMKMPDGECFWTKIYREGDAFQAVIQRSGIFDYISLRSIWIAFSIAALSRQTVSIHASTVMYRGKSVLFLGESGTGKSTHAQLWLNHIPYTELLNDDCPFLRVEADGNIQVYGSPWSGKTPCYKNMHTPVAAFVRLSQAPYNRIRRLTGIEAIAALLPSCPLTFAYDKQLSESIYSVLSHALQQAPVYHLECLPNADAARLVYETLKEDKRL